MMKNKLDKPRLTIKKYGTRAFVGRVRRSAELCVGGGRWLNFVGVGRGTRNCMCELLNVDSMQSDMR